MQKDHTEQMAVDKMRRQLTKNSQIPLQLSLQETWAKFQDPDSIVNKEKPDTVVEFMDQRPMSKSHVMAEPLVFGAMECKRDQPFKRDDTAQHTGRLYASHQADFGVGDSRSLLQTESSRLVTRDKARKQNVDQKRWDKKMQHTQQINGW